MIFQLYNDILYLSFAEFPQISPLLDSIGISSDGDGSGVLTLSDCDVGSRLADCFVIIGDVVPSIIERIPKTLRTG